VSLTKSKYYPYAVSLESEGGILNLNESDIAERQELVLSMLDWPHESFSRMRHLEPQIGCFNRCSFCSQSAGTTVWSLNKKSLANVMAALKYVSVVRALEVNLNLSKQSYLNYKSVDEVFGENRCFNSTFQMPEFGLLGFARTEHRPGVLFCYLDNDIAMYPYLEDLLLYAHQDFGAKIRISSVGYSRHNEKLQSMHTRIASELTFSLAGVRLSLSSYASGWRDSKVTSQDEFVLDISNFLKTYKPAFQKLGAGGRTSCVEFRFRPLLQETDLIEEFIEGRMTLSCGPYFMVSEKESPELPLTEISHEQNARISFNQKPTTFYLICQSGLSRVDKQSIVETINKQNLEKSSFPMQKVPLFKMSNPDGYYYAVSQSPTQKGIFAKQFYPQTSFRKSGYIDSERYFLNAVLSIKSEIETYSWNDVEEVIEALKSKAKEKQSQDSLASTYIREEILPLVEGYQYALKIAGFPAASFFDKDFTRDTGTICNLGRAYSEFRSLASRPNLPITPSHERAYGKRSSLASEGVVWRLAVAPFSEEDALLDKQRGYRNFSTKNPSIMLEELDMSETSSSSGQSLRRYWSAIKKVESISLLSLQKSHLIPGQRGRGTKKLR
jgi:hypothetical protein